MAELLSPYDQHERVVVATSVADPKLHYWADCEPNTFLDFLLFVAIAVLFSLRMLDIGGILVIVALAVIGIQRLRQLSEKPYGVEIYRRNLGKTPNLRRGRRAAAYRSTIAR